MQIWFENQPQHSNRNGVLSLECSASLEPCYWCWRGAQPVLEN